MARAVGRPPPKKLAPKTQDPALTAMKAQLKFRHCPQPRATATHPPRPACHRAARVKSRRLRPV